MIVNRIALCATGIVLAVLSGALVFQSLRVAGLETELAVLGRDLDQASTKITLLEESEKSLVQAREGLTSQVEACQRANARQQASAKARAALMKNAMTVPVQPGKAMVDDETNARAARHINDAAGR